MILFFATIRAIHFASLMSMFGAGAYLTLLRRRWHLDISATGLRLLFLGGASLAFVTAIVWLCLVAGQMSGDWSQALNPASIGAVASSTRFGQVFLVRLVGLVALWLICFRKGPSQNLLPVVLAALLLGSLGLTSHTAASSGALAAGRAANDAVHLLAGGFWVGGLIVLAMLMRRHRHNGAVLLEPLRLFSDWGMIVVAALVITGLINALSILPVSVGTLRDAYAKVLLAKVALASVMIALAMLNRWGVTPSMRGGDSKATDRSNVRGR
jgi:putative copper resistance protein D